jgi:hypothetical protein
MGLLLQVSYLTYFFDPEDGGDMFRRNVRLLPNYIALQKKDRAFLYIYMFECNKYATEFRV